MLKINTKTNTAQGLLKYDEDGGGDDGEEEGARDHFGSGEGEDGRDPLDPELVCLRKSIRKNVRCVCEAGKYGSAAGRPPPACVFSWCLRVSPLERGLPVSLACSPSSGKIVSRVK